MEEIDQDKTDYFLSKNEGSLMKYLRFCIYLFKYKLIVVELRIEAT